MSQKIELYDGKGTLISVTDTRNLETVKTNKWNEINEYREVILNQGLWFMGYNWGTDGRSRTNITGAVASMTAGIPLPEGFTWRDNNNNNVPFNGTLLVALGGNLMAYVNMVYEASWAMKTVVDALETLSEVDDFIVAKQSWPDGNMDGSMPMLLQTNLANASVGEIYTANFVLTGGKAPYSYAVSNGALPDGLVLSNSSITGTPTANGTSTFTVTATDSYTPNATVSGIFTLTVN